MAVAGQTIANPQTGERITFRRTAADTDGALLELGYFVAPGGAPVAAHVHLEQVETFDVRSGSLRISIGGAERTLGPGDRVSVPSGTPHAWQAIGCDELQMIVTIEPALTAERLYEELFALGSI